MEHDSIGRAFAQPCTWKELNTLWLVTKRQGAVRTELLLHQT